MKTRPAPGGTIGTNVTFYYGQRPASFGCCGLPHASRWNPGGHSGLSRRFRRQTRGAGQARGGLSSGPRTGTSWLATYYTRAKYWDIFWYAVVARQTCRWESASCRMNDSHNYQLEWKRSAGYAARELGPVSSWWTNQPGGGAGHRRGRKCSISVSSLHAHRETSSFTRWNGYKRRSRRAMALRLYTVQAEWTTATTRTPPFKTDAEMKNMGVV